jgi:hypothetical protein
MRFCLFLKLLPSHLPQLEVDGLVVSRKWLWDKGGEFHLYHACAKLPGIIKLPSHVLRDLASSLGKSVLSRDDIVDRVLYVRALSFELGFASEAILLFLLLAATTCSVASVIGSRGWGTSPTRAA